ncbi:MAG TPA: adenylate/guanylate cyclase domain-containing protein [Ktedonobacteraceae bacterium]
MVGKPDPSLEASRDLRSLGEALVRISRTLHEHSRKLEVAVEGTYAGESGDARVQLLGDSLRICRTSDLELGRINQMVQRSLLSFQEQMDRFSQTPPPPSFTLPGQGQGAGQAASSFEKERDALNASIISLERKRSELETLYEIARMLNSTLEFDEVLRLVMDQVIQVVGAERGFMVLLDPLTGDLRFEIARDKEARSIKDSDFEYQISRSTVERVVRTRKPFLSLHDAQVELSDAESVLMHGIRSIMCAPLIVRDNCIGAVYVDSRITAGLFLPKQGDLLMAFCRQAAIAIDNARLFAELNLALRKVEEDKQYMDNIFASIANGVITTDSAGMITKFNDAAGFILNINPLAVVGRPYEEVFSVRSQVGLSELLRSAYRQHEHGTVVPHSVDCEIPGRGPVNLSLHASALRDAQGQHIGMALVVDDQTDLRAAKAKAEEIRRIFGRFVNPNVVKRLIEDPRALHLGGEVKEITVISADVRGFTSLSERLPSAEVMHLLNTYLDIMVKEIWEENGTITGFWGDELLAVFNAPLDQDDHTLRAVRAAWKMRVAVMAHQQRHHQDYPIAFGFGVNTGEAMVGNIGSRELMQNYTVIGDAVNVAARLQKNASDNNVLLNLSTFTRVRNVVNVTMLPQLKVKNKSEPLDVFCLTGWLAGKL